MQKSRSISAQSLAGQATASRCYQSEKAERDGEVHNWLHLEIKHIIDKALVWESSLLIYDKYTEESPKLTIPLQLDH